MDPINGVADLILQIFLFIISIPLQIKELISPSPIKQSDFRPIGNRVFRDNCFYLKFPCRKYQVYRTTTVIEFWKSACYIDHGDEFVFLEYIFDDTPWSLLTIRFRPKMANSSITYNIFDSNVSFSQTNNYQLTQIENLEQYIKEYDDSDIITKQEYLKIINKMKSGKNPDDNALNKLLNFVIKSKDAIGTIADITGIISFIMSFFN